MKPAANSKLAFSYNQYFIFLFAKHKTELNFNPPISKFLSSTLLNLMD